MAWGRDSLGLLKEKSDTQEDGNEKIEVEDVLIQNIFTTQSWGAVKAISKDIIIKNSDIIYKYDISWNNVPVGILLKNIQKLW